MRTLVSLLNNLTFSRASASLVRDAFDRLRAANGLANCISLYNGIIAVALSLLLLLSLLADNVGGDDLQLTAF